MEMGGGSAARGGRLAADDMARRSRRLSRGRSSDTIGSSCICCTAPVHDFTFLIPALPCHTNMILCQLSHAI